MEYSNAAWRSGAEILGMGGSVPFLFGGGGWCLLSRPGVARPAVWG